MAVSRGGILRLGFELMTKTKQKQSQRRKDRREKMWTQGNAGSLFSLQHTLSFRLNGHLFLEAGQEVEKNASLTAVLLILEADKT